MKVNLDLSEPDAMAAVATTGPLMMSASARKRIGVEPGDVVSIEPERGGSCIHRRVYRVPQEIIDAAKEDPEQMPFKLRETMWMNIGDFRLMGIDTPYIPCQEPVKCTVTKSDEEDDSEEYLR